MAKNSREIYFAWATIVASTAGILWYFALAIDMIPDNVPIVGYIDDALVSVFAAYLLSKMYRKLKGRK